MAEQWQNGRGVGRRIFVRGELVLNTPTHLGNGDTEAITDIPLQWDSLENNRPLLTGTSIAGALRNYLREYESGFGVAENHDGSLLAEKLFGHLFSEQATVESWLMVDDALGSVPATAMVEIRDGVKIDPETRTAEDKKKYDMELLPAGTRFDLQFELWLPGKGARDLLRGFVIALSGLEKSEIGLGMRKRRGFGQCRVKGWQVIDYSMDQPAGILGWLEHRFSNNIPIQPIADWFDVGDIDQHRGNSMHIDATFNLLGSILIRAEGEDAEGADMVHLRSWRHDGDIEDPSAKRPVLSGTSLAGALRARALRIVNTLDKHTAIVEEIFGRSDSDSPAGSRLLVQENVIKGGIDDLVQSRVKIDRFTGGAYPQALFTQQPLWAKENAKGNEPPMLEIRLELRQQGDQTEAFRAHAGLLLLLLKDLWTGDLALGGESSVGRGRLQGRRATITAEGSSWSIKHGDNDCLHFNGADPQRLEDDYLQTFLAYEPKQPQHEEAS